MLEFRESSDLKGNATMEIVDGDNGVICVIYREGDKGIRMVSAHFDGEAKNDDGKTGWPPVPALHIKFNPRRWAISGNKIIREGEEGWDAVQFELERGLRKGQTAK